MTAANEELADRTTVNTIMSTPVRTLSAEQDFRDAARLMLRHKVGAALIVDHLRVRGIVTEADLLQCYLKTAKLLADAPWRTYLVGETMSGCVITLSPDDAIGVAYQQMLTSDIRHLPIADPDTQQLLGIVSDRDVRRYFIQAIPATGRSSPKDETTVDAIMSRDLYTLSILSTLSEAAKLMLDHRIGALPVLEEGNLLGIVTSSDLLLHIATSDG